MALPFASDRVTSGGLSFHVCEWGDACRLCGLRRDNPHRMRTAGAQDGPTRAVAVLFLSCPVSGALAHCARGHTPSCASSATVKSDSGRWQGPPVPRVWGHSGVHGDSETAGLRGQSPPRPSGRLAPASGPQGPRASSAEARGWQCTANGPAIISRTPSQCARRAPPSLGTAKECRVLRKAGAEAPPDV